jgi:2-polyprenyl-3-methyl-5-hydroxy-6-metoxy-1,4-benzoquinol methylase
MKLRWKIAQAAEIRWWQNYLKQKPKADYLVWKKEYWSSLFKETGVALNDNDRILDAGCGPAGIFMIFDDNQVDAVDPLLKQYEEKLKHFSPKDYPNVKFIDSPLEKFTLSQPYDTVWCLNAINHVADLDLCFDILAAAVRRGGTLVCSIDAHNHSFFKHIFRLLPGDILHPHQYDLEEYQKMLTDRGFKIEKSLLKDKQFFFNYYVLVAKK